MSGNCTYQHPDGTNCILPKFRPQDGRCEFHLQVDSVTRRYSAGTNLLNKYIESVVVYNQSVKIQGVKFNKLEFSKAHLRDNIEVLFDEAEFAECKFRDWTLRNASFRNSKFKDTVFRNATFLGNLCTFEGAIFDCIDTIFDSCKFDLDTKDLTISNVNFNNTSIIARRHLFSSSFVRASSLTMAECELDSNYLHFFIAESNFDSIYLSTLTLRGVNTISLIGFRFEGTFHVSQHVEVNKFSLKTHDSDSKVPNLKFLLHNINFSKMKYVHFYKVDLRDTWFRSSEIESLKFRSCSWLKCGGYKLLREDQVDESSNVKDTEEVIRLYTQLKKNFEDSRDHIGAGDWFYREMEARRRAMKNEITNGENSIKRRLHFLAMIIYKAVSNYGEDYFKPLLWLIAVLFLSAFSYMVNGFVLGSQDEVNYRFARENPVTLQHIQDFLMSLLASISAMALQVGKVVVFTSLGSITTFIFQFVSTAVLLSFFLLALRRKFRR